LEDAAVTSDKALTYGNKAMEFDIIHSQLKKLQSEILHQARLAIGKEYKI